MRKTKKNTLIFFFLFEVEIYSKLILVYMYVKHWNSLINA